MANKGMVKTWKNLSQRGRMYLVLALCCLMVVISCVFSLLVIGFDDGALALPGGETEPNATAAPLSTESNYDMNQNVIDTGAYAATVLPESDDAGLTYVAETLFLGDSNTARMYRLFEYCTAQNAIGSVGMAARQLATFACAGFAGYNNYVTMPQAVAILQPKRVIITFGTNDLNPSNSAANFISGYQTGIQAVQAAYPSVDIIVNAIPPLGRERSGTSLTQSQVDEYNKSIVTMCEANGWKFLNSAEVLKDPETGFAREGYTESIDGIHLTEAAMEALFTYVRTHSYITEDDRPALTSVPARGEDRDVVVPQVPVVSEPDAAGDAAEGDGTEEGGAAEEGYGADGSGEDVPEGEDQDGENPEGEDADGTEPGEDAPEEAEPNGEAAAEGEPPAAPSESTESPVLADPPVVDGGGGWSAPEGEQAVDTPPAVEQEAPAPAEAETPPAEGDVAPPAE